MNGLAGLRRGWLSWKIQARDVEIDEAALEKLSALAQAQLDANKLKASELNILRRKEQEALSQTEETVKLRYEVQRLINELDKLADEMAASILAEKLMAREVGQIRSEMESLQSTMILLLTERNPVKVTEAIDELDSILSKKKQLKQHKRNLSHLQEQAAKFGSLDIPLKLANQIEAELEKIAEIEDELNG